MTLPSAYGSDLLLAAPVVDIDGTFFIQAGIFLVLMVLLQQLLFKPWLEVQARRNEKIDGAFAQAEALERKAKQYESEYAEDLRKAREAALTMRSKSRHEKEAEGETLVSSARSEAAAELGAEKARIRDEATKARSALEGRIDELAENITQKVLGRSA